MQANLSREEVEFIGSLFHPVVFFDCFIPEIHKEVDMARNYQIEMLLDNSRVSVTKAARGVGKTTTVESDILQTMLTNPKKEGLLTTPNKAHIDPLWNRITTFVRSHPFWNSFITRIVKSDTYTIEAKNGFILHGRISGSSKGASVLSLHVDFLWVDEGQLYMGTGLDQLQGCIKANCRIRIYGVPNGMRKGYLSIAWNDHVIPEKSKHKITKFQDPTFTEEEHQRLIRTYGGKSSQAYLNQVLAEDGIATQKTFNPMYYNKIFVEVPSYEVFEFDGKKINEKEIDETKIAFPIVPPEAIELNISADLGYHPDPTVCGIWYTTQNDMSFLLCKFILYFISYTRQAKFFDKIASIMGVKNVALEIGGPGQTVYLDMNSNDLYPDKKYNVIGVDFRSNVPIGLDNNGNIIKDNAKCYATQLIRDAFEKKKMFLPANDLLLYDEIDSNTQYSTSRGTFSYVGVDHHIDMIRCYVLTKLLQKEVKQSDFGVVRYVDF